MREYDTGLQRGTQARSKRVQHWSHGASCPYRVRARLHTVPRRGPPQAPGRERHPGALQAAHECEHQLAIVDTRSCTRPQGQSAAPEAQPPGDRGTCIRPRCSERVCTTSLCRTSMSWRYSLPSAQATAASRRASGRTLAGGMSTSVWLPECRSRDRTRSAGAPTTAASKRALGPATARRPAGPCARARGPQSRTASHTRLGWWPAAALGTRHAPAAPKGVSRVRSWAPEGMCRVVAPGQAQEAPLHAHAGLQRLGRMLWGWDLTHADPLCEDYQAREGLKAYAKQTGHEGSHRQVDVKGQLQAQREACEHDGLAAQDLRARACHPLTFSQYRSLLAAVWH